MGLFNRISAILFRLSEYVHTSLVRFSISDVSYVPTLPIKTRYELLFQLNTLNIKILSAQTINPLNKPKAILSNPPKHRLF